MTVSGMTGFCRLEGSAGAWNWAVEARSVNGRNLDLRFRGPPGFDGLERLAREAAQARFQRGQISVNVQARRSESAGQARINVEALERYVTLCEPFVAAGRAQAPRMDGLLALRGVVETGDEDDEPEVRAAVESAMAASVTGALDGLKRARLEEGAALGGLLRGFLAGIEALVDAAEGEAGAQPALIKERFERRLTELAGEAASPERIVQEAAAMAVKADVREELDRLASHIDAGRVLLAEEAAAGRRLDFLTQELMREANTLCAKSAAVALTAIGLELKATVDQFREQVQNVE
jgi:uncharacterized protein (TIGR00255 family)